MISKTFNILAYIVCIFVILTIFTGVSYAEEVKAIHAFSGDPVVLNGQGAPYTNVTVSIMRTITVPVSNGRFSRSIDGILVPKGSILSLNASPVTVLKVNGVIHDSTFSSLSECNISGDIGTLLLDDIPDGDYDVTIYGNSPATQVSLTIVASQNITCDGFGLYEAMASSKGLPVGIYTVTANGMHIADIYLEQKVIPAKTPSLSSSSNLLESDWLPGTLVAVIVLIFSLIVVDMLYRNRNKK
jgi:hypothetical protein